MTGQYEPKKLLVICTAVEHYEMLPMQDRAVALQCDGPYERLTCEYCGRAMLLSTQGRAALDDGSADDACCTFCLASMVKQKRA